MPTKKLTPLPATAQITIPEHVEEAFLRSSQVCKMFNISESQLKKLRADGIIPAYKLGKPTSTSPRKSLQSSRK